MSVTVEATRWELELAKAIQLYFQQTALKNGAIDISHVIDTPERMVRAFRAQVAGCSQDPRDYLQKRFTNGDYDEMITVHDIRLVSLCAHHGFPIFGKVDFAYIPDSCIVGLSKIPRFIRVLSHRPQVQEALSEQIANIFNETVEPSGCAVRIRAYHGCMLLRGVEEPMSYTTTTALRGCFKTNPETRAEFLQSLPNSAVFP